MNKRDEVFRRMVLRERNKLVALNLSKEEIEDRRFKSFHEVKATFERWADNLDTNFETLFSVFGDEMAKENDLSYRQTCMNIEDRIKAMKTVTYVCSWCNSMIRILHIDSNENMTSHGICSTCKDLLKEEINDFKTPAYEDKDPHKQ